MLIDSCIAIGASDAGIYVGQSERIKVINSEAKFNVAGIEIENSYFAEVTNGLVRKKNVLSVLMQCISVACLASVLWLVIGYSLAFGEGNQWIGDTSKMFLSGVGRDTLSGDIPEKYSHLLKMQLR